MKIDKDLQYVVIVLAVALVGISSMIFNGSSFLTGEAVVSSFCEDSDPTNDYYTKGVVERKTDAFEDYCTNDGKRLMQYYCSSSNKISKTRSYVCPYGCENGACLSIKSKCGNGIINFGETCDDGNLINGDGCSTSCFSEGGFTCKTTSVCGRN